MTNYVIPSLASAVVGFTTTSFVGVNTTFTIDYYVPANSNKNISFTETRPGWLTGRRPSQGQLFPRGVYNK